MFGLMVFLPPPEFSMDEKIDLKLKKEIRAFLDTKAGMEYTTLGGLAAHFNLSMLEMFLKIGWPDKVILDNLERNKFRIKEKMRHIWRNSNKPNLLISAYRLEADEDELIRLSGESPKAKSLERKDPLLEVLKPEDVWKDDAV